MKSLHRGGIAGNLNLKGKKSRVLSCQCCIVQDFREQVEQRRIRKELDQPIYGPDELSFDPWFDWERGKY